jgi:transcriptional regulator GlxA family with amidase domain
MLTAAQTFRTLRGPVDTLLVAGGTGMDLAVCDEQLLLWMRKTAQRVRRIGSVCTGAFLLAAAGLLDGKRAATHWKWAAELASKYKHTIVDPDPIYIRDGNTYTTAGVTAGMDLALALVEEDLGAPTALKVARELVLYLRRAGGQSQFSTALALQASDRKQIAELRAWALDNLDKNLTVEELAAKAGMSPRNFARVFLKDTGTTPARFVERLRVEAARRRLEESRDKLEKVANDCGFGSLQTLRRSFLRVGGHGPTMCGAGQHHVIWGAVPGVFADVDFRSADKHLVRTGYIEDLSAGSREENDGLRPVAGRWQLSGRLHGTMVRCKRDGSNDKSRSFPATALKSCADTAGSPASIRILPRPIHVDGST